MEKIIYIILLIFIVSGCTENIDLALNSMDTRMLVVEGQITSDTTSQWIKLSYTSDYYDTLAYNVNNVNVMVSDGTNTCVFSEDPEVAGLYKTKSDYYGIPGKTYKLTISGIDTDEDGQTETYTAESKMPDIPLVDSIRLSLEHKFYIDVLQISIYALDSPEKDDAYMYKLYKNNFLLTDSLSEWRTAEDELFNGERLEDEPVIYLNQDIDEYKVKGGDLYTLVTSHIPHDYYLFLEEAQEEYRGSNPFSGNPANISTNISGPHKACGFFAAYSTDWKEKVFRIEE